MSKSYKKYLSYIKNTGGRPLISWFDGDWEPIGPTVRKEMVAAGLIEDDGHRIYIKGKKPEAVKVEGLIKGKSADVLIIDDPHAPKPCCERDHNKDGNCDRHPDPKLPNIALLIKLGSIVVHCEEMLEQEEVRKFFATLPLTAPSQFDRGTIDVLLEDPQVKAWLDSMTSKAFLPVKRK